MVDNGGAKVSSAELMTLQSDLVNLSNQLHELYELMNSDVSSLAEYWRDQKFDEFLTGYQPQMEKMEEISVRYHEWATKDLQVTIDNVIATEGVDVSGDSVGSSGSSSPSGGGGNSSDPLAGNMFGKKKSKADRFREASREIKDGMEKAAVLKYIWDSKSERGAKEREYPHEGIIAQYEEEEKKKKEQMNQVMANILGRVSR
jgi:hypothetical protein